MTHPFRFLATAAVLLGSLVPTTDAQARSLVDESDAYRVEILIDGVPARAFSRRGETWVLGQLGERYEVRVTNNSNRRIEAVVSVDGRDVIAGTRADYRNQRGYLVAPYDSVTIDGWRLSAGQAAAFRFGTVADSYAALTGSAREVGVIGVAVFRERESPVRPWIARSAPGSAARGRQEQDAAPAPQREGAASASESSANDRSARKDAAASADERPGLGTEFGETRHSPIEHVAFTREHATRPVAVLGLRYDDARGLRAQGIDIDRHHHRHERIVEERELRRSADPFPGERGYARPPRGWRGDGR